MPPSNGWNEVDVRQSQDRDQTAILGHFSSKTLKPSAASSTISVELFAEPWTMAFTPINASRRSRQLPPAVVSASTQEYNGPPAVQPTRLMVAEYLGRGDVGVAPREVPVSTRVTRGSEANKRANIAKKRPTTTNDQSISKRRKSSNVAESMLLTKPAASKTKRKGKAENMTPDVIEDIPSQAVSLFSSSTSMESLSAPSQQTSMDAVKTSQGFGTTVYLGPQCTTGIQASSTVAEPCLDPKAARSRYDRAAKFPQEAPNGGGAAKEVNLYGTQIHQQLKSAGKTIDSSRTMEEDDFAIGEDEGFEEAMALAESLEVRPRLPKNVQQGSKRRSSVQLREARAKQSGSTAALTNQHAPIVVSSRTLSESFIVGEDEDMDEALATLVDTETSSRPRDQQSTRTMYRQKSANTKNKTNRRRKNILDNEPQHENDQPLNLEDNYVLVEDDDEAVVQITRDVEEAADQRSPTPPTRQWKLNMREVDEHEDYGGALLSEAERQILDSIKASQQNTVKPIVRAGFPRPILDRSPLFGAYSGTTLRTCFRIGEALKEGSLGVRMNSNIVIELYARVVSSRREDRKQHFLFHDLYHDRPPYLHGTCELWDQTKLWELDTRAFLGAERETEGVICRAIAKMKRKDGAAGKGWMLDVLSIWEARWEDVEFVAGIYCKDRRESAEEEYV